MHDFPRDMRWRVRVILRARVRFETKKGALCMILTSCSPESTSRRRISMRPSRRSVYKSPMRQVTRPKWEFTHLVKVFFCTASRSSAIKTIGEGLKSHYTKIAIHSACWDATALTIITVREKICTRNQIFSKQTLIQSPALNRFREQQSDSKS